MVAVCRLCSPPARSRTAATAPLSTAQNTRRQVGVSSAPSAVMVSITSAAESAEVTKKTTTSSVARTEERVASGNCSRKTKSASGTLVATVSETAVVRPESCSQMAVFPKTVIHTSVKPVGTKRTPTTNSRMVRPREMRAMNIPTKGDQEIHQAQ